MARTEESKLEVRESLTSEPQSREKTSRLRWLFRVAVLIVLAVVGVFVWGFFQPKPTGFSPTNPDAGAFITDDWTRYTIDATDRENWVFFNFGLGRAVDASFTTPDWDVAFKRTDLLTNSGVTNPAGEGGAMNLGEIPLESATAPPSAAFSFDEFGGEDGDDQINPEISRWYDYSFITHTVHVKAQTYLIRAGEDRDALVFFDSYYCEDEAPGCITFRYRLIPRVDTS